MIKTLNQPIVIEWHKFRPGTSFFIPCIDRSRVQRAVLKEAFKLRIDDVICKQVIENGVYGLRVWRRDPTMDPHSASPV